MFVTLCALHEQHCGVCLPFVLFLMSTAAAGASSLLAATTILWSLLL